MREGYLFFALMWLGCWYLIFISDEMSEVRRWRLVRLLLGISLAGLSIHVFFININLFLISAVLWSVYQWRAWKNIRLLKSTLAVIFIAIALICIRIFSVLYPIWFIINWIFIAAILLVGLSIILMHADKRVTVLTIGIIFGEVAYSSILYWYGFPIENVGSFESMDLLLLTLTITVVINKTQSMWAGRMLGRKVYPPQQIGLKGK